MTDGENETIPDDSGFAAFEAAAANDEPVQTPDKDEAEPDEQPPEVNDEADKPDEEDEPEAKDEGKRRSKPAHQRIAELTAKLRQAERDLAARVPAPEAPPVEQQAPAAFDTPAPDPNDDKYEFGEADPNYLADLTDWKVEKKLAERDAKAAEDAAKQRQASTAAEIDGKWNEQAAKGAEKYEDFNEVVLESAAAGEWACPPLVAAAISISPVGHDAAYHLAKNPVEAELIATELATNPLAAAERFGAIEGQFLDKAPARPESNHPLDMAIHAGRLRAFLDKQSKPKGKLSTDAPEPPKHQVRGAAGQFEVGGDTTDFAAFERKANAAAAKK